jgi:hypothetical protein
MFYLNNYHKSPYMLYQTSNIYIMYQQATRTASSPLCLITRVNIYCFNVRKQYLLFLQLFSTQHSTRDTIKKTKSFSFIYLFFLFFIFHLFLFFILNFYRLCFQMYQDLWELLQHKL